MSKDILGEEDVPGEHSDLESALRDHVSSQHGLTADTTIKLSITQWLAVSVVIFSIISSVVGSVWFFKQELIEVRMDVKSAIQTMTSSIEKLDYTWQIQSRDMTDDIKQANLLRNLEMRKTVDDLRNRIPEDFPPASWVKNVYDRDIKQLNMEIEEINEFLKTK